MKYTIPFFFLTVLLMGAGCGSEQDAPNVDALEALSDQIETLEQETIDKENAFAADQKEDEDVSQDELADEPTDEPTDELADEPSDTLEPLAISMEAGNFFFSPSTITASPGQELSLSFASVSGAHTFVIDEIGFKKGLEVGTVLTFTAPTIPGSYAYYCDVGSHRALGMEGTLIVR